MAWKGWATLPDGSIEVHPVTGWDIASFENGRAGGLKLVYALDPQGVKRSALQCILTEAQARELSRTLAILADKLAADMAAHEASLPSRRQ